MKIQIFQVKSGTFKFSHGFHLMSFSTMYPTKKLSRFKEILNYCRKLFANINNRRETSQNQSTFHKIINTFS